MLPPTSSIVRTAVRSLPGAVGAVAAAAVVFGFFSEIAAVGPWHVGLLAALLASIGVLGWSRVKRAVDEAPPAPWMDVEFGALLLVAGFAVAQPAGGVDSPLFPIVYLLLAFLVIFLPTRAAVVLIAISVALDVAVFAAAGVLATGWSTLLSHVVLLLLFGAMSRLVFIGSRAGGLAGSALIERARQRQLDEKARQYRLGLDAAEDDEPLDVEQWLRAAVQEVEEAMGNALEVAECALRPHTVAVFLLSGDDRTLKLQDCRSRSGDVIGEPFEPREGILGAVLKRRMPMRLCGDIKGVSWYEGRKPVRSVLAIPLVDRRGAGGAGNEDGSVCGVLVADRLEPLPFGDEDERLLAAISREVLRAIDIERVMGTVRRGNDRQKQFHEAIQELNTRSKIDEVLETTLRLARGVTPLDLLAVTTVEDIGQGQVVHQVARVEGHDKLVQLQGRTFPDNNGLVANAIRYEAILPGRELKVLEKPLIFDAGSSVRGLLSLKILPIRAGGRPIGALVCGAKRRRALENEEISLLKTIAMQAGEAILRARLFAQTEQMATKDGLTGLLNHRTFQAKFDEELDRARRSRRDLTLLITDIDHFKSINDTYGHATGDKVLHAVAKLLETCARTTDVVARYGGEEFALLLPETDMDGGKIIAERIRAAVEQHVFATDLGELKCTLSIGVASFPDVSEVKKVLFEKADQCLYHCKRMGRNRTCTVPEMGRDEGTEEAA